MFALISKKLRGDQRPFGWLRLPPYTSKSKYLSWISLYFPLARISFNRLVKTWLSDLYPVCASQYQRLHQTI